MASVSASWLGGLLLTAGAGALPGLAAGTGNCSNTAPSPDCLTPLKNNGGTTQVNPKLYFIFWGPNWSANPSPEATLKAQVLALFGSLNGTAYEAILTQYLGNGNSGVSVNGNWIDATAPAGLNGAYASQKTSITNEISKAVQANMWTVDGNSQFFVFTQSGTAIANLAGDTATPDYCAYHTFGTVTVDAMGTQARAIYDFEPWLSAAGTPDGTVPGGCPAPGDTSPGQAELATATHEFMEAASDPLSSAWYTPAKMGNNEIGDICSSYPGILAAGVTGPVQPQWDNASGSCTNRSASNQSGVPGYLSTTAGWVGGPNGIAAPTGTTAPPGAWKTATAATLNSPSGVATDSRGDVFIADSGNNTVWEVTPDGKIAPFAGTGSFSATAENPGTAGYSGDGGVATAAQLNNPLGVGTDASGNVLIADTGNNVIRMVCVVAGTYYGQAMTAGNIYTVAGNGTAGYGGDGLPARMAQLNVPKDVVADSSGDLFIADSANNRIREVLPAGIIATFAGTGTAGYAGDGSLAAAAQLNAPAGVGVDSKGDVVIADTNNNAVRFVPVGAGTFYGQAMTPLSIYTIAGTGTAGYSGDNGLATNAMLNAPKDVAVDGYGDVAIADANNNRIRVVGAAGDGTKNGGGAWLGVRDTAGNPFSDWGVWTRTGFIYTVAGSPATNTTTGATTNTPGFSGDGLPAIYSQSYLTYEKNLPTPVYVQQSQLNSPVAVGFAPDGTLYIADRGNNLVRQIWMLSSTGTPASSVPEAATPALLVLAALSLIGLVEVRRKRRAAALSVRD